ncbi:MAG: hypothetical protein JSR90_00755 [Proteobacteria bacterium]|nr:hypothetical protein [Pseudomonadota bacterium]
MVMIWRGWGILALFVPLVWFLVPIFGFVIFQVYEPDSVKVTASFLRLEAAAQAAAALTLWLVTRYRAHAPAGADHFLFVPLRFWTWLIGLIAVVAFVASFLGLDFSA